MPDHSQHAFDIASLILGATHSVSLIINLDPQSRDFVNEALSFELGSIAPLAEDRLQLRCIAYMPPQLKGPSYEELRHSVAYMAKAGWKVRFLAAPPTKNCLIVDDRVVLVADAQFEDMPIRFSRDSYEAALIRHHFTLAWHSNRESALTEEVVYEDLILSSTPSVSRQLASISSGYWDFLIGQINQDPSILFTLPPRKFEELIAELLLREGFDVQLTPQTRDGGRDVLAFQNTSLGRHLYLVECKRYSPSKPVSVSLVRALYGVVEQERASSGVLVTTSSFTADALKFRDQIKFRLSLKDYDDLTKWIRSADPVSS